MASPLPTDNIIEELNSIGNDSFLTIDEITKKLDSLRLEPVIKKEVDPLDA